MFGPQAGFEFLVNAVDVVFERAGIARHFAAADFDHGGRHALHEVAIVARENDRAGIAAEGVGQRLDRFDVEMVARFVEDQHVVLFEQQAGEHKRARSPPLSTLIFFWISSPRNSKLPATSLICCVFVPVAAC